MRFAPIMILAGLLLTSAEGRERLPVLWIDDAGLEWLRSEAKSDDGTKAAYKELFEDAKSGLRKKPLSVTQKEHVPPSGDLHDYFSLSRYWWPDEEKEGGLPWVQKDGETNPESKSDTVDAQRLRELSRWVECLTLCYAISEEEKYATKAVELLEAWFLNPELKMNPNFRYAGSVPGVADGRASGLIEINSLARIFSVIGSLDGSGAVTDEVATGLQQWAEEFLSWMLVSKLGREEATAENNHGTWYDVYLMTFALFVGNDAMARQVAEESVRSRQEDQFDDFGKQKYEIERTKSLSYSLYNLEAHLRCVELAERVGIDLWVEDYDRAFSFAGKSVIGSRKWRYEQIDPLDPRQVLRVARLVERTRGNGESLTQLVRDKREFREAVEQIRFPLIPSEETP